MDDSFSKEKKAKEAAACSEIYDVTAWSLPLQYNVQAIPCAR